MKRQYNKTNKISALLCLIALFAFSHTTAMADENGMLTGLVTDVSKNSVAKVLVYVYDDANIRRPADYISSPTDTRGEFKITLPPGHYWVVARLRQNDQTSGPLLPGDKHSGAPLEIDVRAGEQLEEEFVIADLKETAKLTVKVNTSYIRVEGVLQTKEGEPVGNAYPFANRQPVAKKMPDYIGPWTDQSGKFILYLPGGTYYFGQALTFPPGSKTVPAQKVSINGKTKNTLLVIR